MRFLAVAGAICLLAVTAHADRPAPVADDVISGVTMPRNLSDYNFFQDVGGRKPNKGVTLYRLNSPLFTDYADKYRYIYVPSGKTVSINPDNPEGMMQFPVGSAIIKSFGYEMDGKPIPVRNKGPLMVIYNFDQHPELRNEAYYGRSIWQIQSLKVMEP